MCCLHLCAWLHLFLSVVEIFMSSGTVTVLFPYCDILIFGWTIPNISVKGWYKTKDAASRVVMKMDIYFSLSGHNSHSDSLGVDFTESQRLHTPVWLKNAPKTDHLHPTPQTYKCPSVLLNIAVNNVSLTLCLTYELSSDMWMITSSSPRIFTTPGPVFIRQTGCVRGTYGFLIIVSNSILRYFQFRVHYLFILILDW